MVKQHRRVTYGSGDEVRNHEHAEERPLPGPARTRTFSGCAAYAWRVDRTAGLIQEDEGPVERDIPAGRGA